MVVIGIVIFKCGYPLTYSQGERNDIGNKIKRFPCRLHHQSFDLANNSYVGTVRLLVDKENQIFEYCLLPTKNQLCLTICVYGYAINLKNEFLLGLVIIRGHLFGNRARKIRNSAMPPLFSRTSFPPTPHPYMY